MKAFIVIIAALVTLAAITLAYMYGGYGTASVVQPPVPQDPADECSAICAVSCQGFPQAEQADECLRECAVFCEESY